MAATLEKSDVVQGCKKDEEFFKLLQNNSRGHERIGANNFQRGNYSKCFTQEFFSQETL